MSVFIYLCVSCHSPEGVMAHTRMSRDTHVTCVRAYVYACMYTHIKTDYVTCVRAYVYACMYTHIKTDYIGEDVQGFQELNDCYFFSRAVAIAYAHSPGLVLFPYLFNLAQRLSRWF